MSRNGSRRAIRHRWISFLFRSVAALVLLLPILAGPTLSGRSSLCRVPGLQVLRAALGHSGRVSLLVGILPPPCRRDDLPSRRPDLRDADRRPLPRRAVGWRRWAAVIAGFAGIAVVALGPRPDPSAGRSSSPSEQRVVYAVFLGHDPGVRGTSDIVMATWQIVRRRARHRHRRHVLRAELRELEQQRFPGAPCVASVHHRWLNSRPVGGGPYHIRSSSGRSSSATSSATSRGSRRSSARRSGRRHRPVHLLPRTEGRWPW